MNEVGKFPGLPHAYLPRSCPGGFAGFEEGFVIGSRIILERLKTWAAWGQF